MRLVSVCVPLYNEQDNVAALYKELKSILMPTRDLSYEFIFVDDGSKDDTVQNLVNAVGNDLGVTIVRFRRNFGQTAAMAAGFDFASGDIVVTLDGDLQNDPAEVPAMIAKLDEGYDMVAGWRRKRKDNLLYRTLPSRMGNWVISKITGVRLHDYGCTLKVMRSEVAKNIQLYGQMHRFIPAVASRYGVRLAEMPVNHRPRLHGTSKYGLSKAFRVLLDLLTVKFFLGFATRPLHMFGMAGLISGAVGSLMLLVLGYQRLVLHVPLGNRPILLLAVMLVLIGLQFVCFGLLAEMLARTYHESQNKKIYAVRDVYRTSRKELERKTAVG